MTHKTPKLILRWLIFILGVFAWSLIVQAQADETELSTLMVKIWPEYDRPETLIIYRGQLADSTLFPATVTFNLPPQVEQMFAVAIVSEGGELVTHPYEFGAGRLTLTLDRPDFQFEYYDPAVLAKDDQTRMLKFSAEINYPVSALQIEVQQPSSADSMQFQPAPDQSSVGADQLVYHLFNYQDIPAGPLVTLTGTYTKTDDTLTTKMGVNIPPEAANIAPAETDWTLWMGYVLIGLGAVVLLAVGGIWFYNNRQAGSVTPVKRNGRSQSPVENQSQVQRQPLPAQPASDSRFCHKCGTPYKPDAVFCHKCGAARR